MLGTFVMLVTLITIAILDTLVTLRQLVHVLIIRIKTHFSLYSIIEYKKCCGVRDEESTATFALGSGGMDSCLDFGKPCIYLRSD